MPIYFTERIPLEWQKDSWEDDGITLHGSNKKILAVSFGQLERSAQATAIVTKGIVSIMAVQEIVEHPSVWVPTMIKDVEDKIDKGWVCIIEDRTASLNTRAILYDFDAIDDSGKAHIQTLLSWYGAMQARGAIAFEEGLERYAIRVGGESGNIDTRTDAKGRLLFDFDWRNLGAGHRAVLLCIAAAYQEEPYSERWLKIMCGSYPKVIRPNPLATFNAIKKSWETHHLDFEITRAKRSGDNVLR